MEKTHHHKSHKKNNHQQQQQQQKEPDSGLKREEEPVHLLEDGWFFGNSLNRTPKIVRCFSEPAPSSSERTTEMLAASASSSKTADLLLRTPSLPPNMWREGEDDWNEIEDDDDDDGPRMGDLIRQATMPSNNKLSRLPSLPPASSVRREQQKGPPGKLTRRATLDPSVLLPPCPKHTSNSNSKGLKQASPKSISSSRHHHHHNRGKHDEIVKTRNTGGSSSAGTTPPRTTNKPSLRRTMSLTLTDQEVRGFRDLGFNFDKDELAASAVNGISCLEIKEEEEEEEETQRNNNPPSLSEAWDATRRGGIPKWSVHTIKGSSSSSAEDMKAQIKFWARAVASNVR